MQNRVQSKIDGISHFFLAVGILVLSLLAMFGVAIVVIKNGFGFQLEELTKIDLLAFTKHQSTALKLGQFFTALSFLLAGFVCTKTYKQKFTDFTNLNSQIKPLHFLLGFLMLLALIPIVDGLVRINAALELPEKWASMFSDIESTSNHTYDLFLKHNTGIHLFFNILVMSVLAAVGEEIFFRGILMRVLTKWFNNVHVGIFISSGLFTIMHFQPYEVLPMMLLGLFLGYVYYRTKSLWIPIVLHAFNNAIVVFSDWFDKKGFDFALFSPDFQFSSGTVTTSIVVLVGLGYFFWKKTTNNDFDYA
jgi:membrane protease YdiL (CAAX protease family)